MSDLIDRQAAIDAIVSVDEYNNTLVALKLGDAIREVRKLPSADVQPVRHGHWVNIGTLNLMTNETRRARQCSLCKSSYTENTVDHIPNFCPNCGADMRGAKGDE